MDDKLLQLATRLGEKLSARGLTITTVESCTGGAIAQAITRVPGSSAWFELGLVTYANRAKQALVGVSEVTLAREGAVSEATVREMATGALKVAGADIAIATSGIAGPAGGSPAKPVGTVWFAWAFADAQGIRQLVDCVQFSGDRGQVQAQAVIHALAMLEKKMLDCCM